MYQIIKSGEIIGQTELPRYIRLHTNGCYVGCAEAVAQGVAFGGTPYNLMGRESMGELEEVSVREVDAGETVRVAELTGDDIIAQTLQNTAEIALLNAALGLGGEI